MPALLKVTVLVLAGVALALALTDPGLAKERRPASEQSVNHVG
jgi:hypothetical protein